MSNSVDPDETAHMSSLIWIYAVFKRLLLSPKAMKELKLDAVVDTGVIIIIIKLLFLNVTAMITIAK